MRSRSGAVPSGPCHHSHKTLGSRRLSPRGRRSTSTRMSVPTTMGRGPRAAPSCVVVDLRVQLGPRSHAHASVTGVLAAVLGGGFGPGARDQSTSSSARGDGGVRCVRGGSQRLGSP